MENDIIDEIYNFADGNDDILSDTNGGEDIKNSMWALSPENISEDYDRNIADSIANQITNKLNLNQPKYISSGRFGVAYDINNNLVLKITKDRSEVNENIKLIGKQLKYIAKPYRVFQINSKNNDIPETYAIILEKLQTSPEIERLYNRLDFAFGSILDVRLSEVIEEYLGFEDNEKINKNKVDAYLKKNPQDAEFFAGLLRIAEEAHNLGIKSLDFYNWENLGYKKNCALAFFDVGFGGEISQPQGAETIEVSEEFGGSSLYSTANSISSDDFPTYEQNDTSPLTDNNIPTSIDELTERIMSSMKGSSTVDVKKKCKLGGLGNTSAACNQGNINNFNIKSLNESNIPYNRTFWGWVSPDNRFIEVPQLQHQEYIMRVYNDKEYGWDYDRVFNQALKDGWVRVIFEYNQNRYMGNLSINGYDKQRVRFVFKNMFFNLVAYGYNVIYLQYENPEGTNIFSTRDDEGKAKMINYVTEEIVTIDESLISSDDNIYKNVDINTLINYVNKLKRYINKVNNKEYLSDEEIDNIYHYFRVYENSTNFSNLIELLGDNFYNHRNFMRNILYKWNKIKQPKNNFSNVLSGVNEEINASEAYGDDYNVLKLMLDNKKNVSIFALKNRDDFKNEIIKNNFGLIPVEQIHHDVDMHIVYRKSHKGINNAQRLYAIMKSKGGYVSDETPKEAYEIGKLLDYSDTSIQKYIDRIYIKDENGNTRRRNPMELRQYDMKDKNVLVNETKLNNNNNITSFINNLKQKPFINSLINNGGEVFAVGGVVRDLILNKSNKDIDLVIKNLSIDDIISILQNFGKVDVVGKSFGVIKFVDNDGIDYDIALPRLEKKKNGFLVKIGQSEVFIEYGGFDNESK